MLLEKVSKFLAADENYCSQANGKMCRVRICGRKDIQMIKWMMLLLLYERCWIARMYQRMDGMVMMLIIQSVNQMIIIVAQIAAVVSQVLL